MEAVWLLPHLLPIDRLVLLCLADFADDDGGNCYPSQETLARRCADPTTVRRSLGRLQRGGWITVEERPRQHRSTRYRLHIIQPRPGAAPSLSPSQTGRCALSGVPSEAPDRASEPSRPGAEPSRPGAAPGDPSYRSISTDPTALAAPFFPRRTSDNEKAPTGTGRWTAEVMRPAVTEPVARPAPFDFDDAQKRLAEVQRRVAEIAQAHAIGGTT